MTSKRKEYWVSAGMGQSGEVSHVYGPFVTQKEAFEVLKIAMTMTGIQRDVTIVNENPKASR